MPKVQLFAPQATRTVEIPVRRRKDRLPIPPSRHREAVFACLREMHPRFDAAGITENDYWTMVKSEFGILSCSELKDSEWARLSATLNACRRDAELFNKLLAKVKAHTAEAVRVQDATPVIFAAPEETIVDPCFVIRRDRVDATQKVVFIGEFSDNVRQRCQDHADKTRCIVELYHNGQKPETFYPSLECSPV